jgi:acetoacetyl-CoA synthetase
MNPQFAQSRLLWKHDCPAHTNVEIMRRMINRKHGLCLCEWNRISLRIHLLNCCVGAVAADYHDLHENFVENYTFWLDLWEFLGIIPSAPPDPKQVLVAYFTIFFI